MIPGRTGMRHGSIELILALTDAAILSNFVCIALSTETTPSRVCRLGLRGDTNIVRSLPSSGHATRERAHIRGKHDAMMFSSQAHCAAYAVTEFPESLR